MYNEKVVMGIHFYRTRLFLVFFAITIVVFILFSSCNSGARHFYSLDKTRCISIITERDERYFINGYYDHVPSSNFIKVSLVNIDRHVADQIVGCWNREGMEWIIFMDNVIVLDNKLDTKRFAFKKDFPTDSAGAPTLIDYDIEVPGCFSISYEYNKLIGFEGDLMEK